MSELVEVGFNNAADDMNGRVMGGRVMGEAVALELVDALLNSKCAGEERRQRRLAKIKAMEHRFGRQTIQ